MPRKAKNPPTSLTGERASIPTKFSRLQLSAHTLVPPSQQIAVGAATQRGELSFHERDLSILRFLMSSIFCDGPFFVFFFGLVRVFPRLFFSSCCENVPPWLEGCGFGFV